MAISNIEDLRTRVLQLIPDGEPITEYAVRTIHGELVNGGCQLSLEDISNELRRIYTDPFLSIKFLEDQLKKYNLQYNN